MLLFDQIISESKFKETKKTPFMTPIMTQNKIPIQKMNVPTSNFVKMIPKDAIKITKISDKLFENLFYYNGEFYLDLGFSVKILKPKFKYNQKIWGTYDIENKFVYFSEKEFFESL